jgi:subtilisin family serine protease
MTKDFARRPSSRLIACSLTFGMLSVGTPGAFAAGRTLPDQGSLAAAANAARPHSRAAQMVSDAAGSLSVFVQLEGEPAINAYARAVNAALEVAPETPEAAARAIGVGAGRSRANALRTQHAAVLPALSKAGARILFEAHRAINGFAVRVEARQLPALRALPGVKGVHVMVPKEHSNSTSVPFLGIPASVWDSGTGAGVTGAGIRIGVIDTGIDYQHANFGGTGLLADYQANDRTSIAEVGAAAFPTAKVVGGWDFAGDAYTAGNLPVPDPDPMDCNGHGSHVAGSAAGFGVTGAGATFTGPYDGSATFDSLSSLRIGPGTAPEAQLYALRVFGCTGSTDLTTAAIEWAMDPNDDDDFSDHLDVINMSLGSSFGSLFDDSAEASNNAAAAGVIVVASAGNSGDVYFVTGAPGGAAGAISVAASADLIPLLTANSGPLSGNQYGTASASFGAAISPAGFTGDLVLAAPADGCAALTNGAAVAGKIAVIDRGTCSFVIKVKNAQDAGAIGAIIANTAAGVFGGLGGSDPTITIPSAMVSYADGNAIKANLPFNATVAQTNAGNTLASFSSRGPRRAWSLKPDVAAPGSSITSTQTGIVCKTGTPNCTAPTAAAFDAFVGILPNNASLTISGTSMAAPHVAGMMATLKQLHPTWKTRELRALLISTSSGDIFTGLNGTGAQYGPGRVGGGLVTMAGAATSEVVMGDGDDYLPMSWERNTESMGTEIGKAYSSNRNLTVLNKGTSSHSYTASYVPVVDEPGIDVSFPNGTSVNLGPKKKINLRVNVSSSGPDSLEVARDSSVSGSQTSFIFGSLPRTWLEEEAGYIVLTPTSEGDPTLRLPFHVAPRPVANVLAKKMASPLALGGTDFLGSSPLTGFPFSLPLVSVFEWQADSPNEDLGTGDPQIERLLDSADIRSVGVSSDLVTGGAEVYFGISTWGNWSTPNEVEFRVYIDADRDGNADYFLFSANSVRSLNITFGDTSYTDSFLTHLCSTTGPSCSVGEDFLNGVSPDVISMGVFNSNVMVLPLWADDAGVAGRFNYWVEGYNREGGLVDTVGSAGSPLTYDPFNQGVDFHTASSLTGPSLFFAFSGEEVPHAFNAANFAANNSLGALLLHHHNAGPTEKNAGNRSETLSIGNWVSVSDASITEGNKGKKTLNFTVSLNAPATSKVTARLATSDNTATLADNDYVAKAGNVSFNVGQQVKSFSVKVVGDTNGCGVGDNGDESFFVSIESASGAVVENGQAEGTILNDEVCP